MLSRHRRDRQAGRQALQAGRRVGRQAGGQALQAGMHADDTCRRAQTCKRLSKSSRGINISTRMYVHAPSPPPMHPPTEYYVINTSKFAACKSKHIVRTVEHADAGA